LILASRSPRRAELLRQLGASFAVIDVEIDEAPGAQEAPADYVRRLARAKAEAGRAAHGNTGAVLAADTSVALAGRLFGKPRDAADGAAILSALSGRRHEVHTAVALATGRGVEACVVATVVEFAPLDAAVIAAYWASGEPADKAGAYGIQGLGGALVTRIEGSYSAVVGLPLCETRALLDSAGIPHALSPR